MMELSPIVEGFLGFCLCRLEILCQRFSSWYEVPQETILPVLLLPLLCNFYPPKLHTKLKISNKYNFKVDYLPLILSKFNFLSI